MSAPAPVLSPSLAATATVSNTSFTEFQPGRATHVISNSPDPLDSDIRQESRLARRALIHGALVTIVINGYQVSTIPLDLLQFASTRVSDLLYVGTIDLPADTDPTGVMTLVHHLVDIARSKAVKPTRLRNNMSIYQSLAVCQAAYRLGITKYTSHVFRQMEAYISNTLLPYYEIDAVLHFGASHPHLYSAMVNLLAVMVRDEAISDADAFAQFCNTRPALNTAIIMAMQWQVAKQEKAQRAKEPAARRQEWVARPEQERVQREQDKLRWAQEQARLNSDRKKHNIEHRAEEKKRTARESAMRQACLAKTRASGQDRIMTAEEKKWYVKEFGKQSPRGC